ncbi:response regulator [Roseateles oligotrophus]|uniref:Response regulator n=1 Tax=Roseateles oligotrophus TaxID=1769250 RepID=A0ABT2YH95_9BURK|nr:response regulator [Roseateles oligotrophus]MCV2369414.1 response regulator [Roseateles oligotrophus]
MHIETPYAKIDALVVDDMATQQTTLRGQLGMLGIGKIDAAGSAEDALRMIKAKRYGLILCDYNLNHRTDGQQLFELLRDQRVLAPDCLFFMITAESNYNSVASASEHMPDAYLLKPITAGDIEDRLKNQLDKRQALLEINRHLNKNDLAAAVTACDTLLAKKDRWYMHALQIKGQALLDLGCPDDAKRIYQDALALRDGLMWAQLGLVKAAKASGKFEESKRLGQEILDSQEGSKCLVAFDLVAASMEALGDTNSALTLMKQAAQVVPSAKRLRVLSESAYRNGDLATAKASLSKALKSSQGAMTANSQDLLIMAQTQIDMGEAKEALETLCEAATRGSHTPEFDNVALAIRAQAHALLGDTDKAQKEAAQALASMRQGKADFATVTVARAALQAGQVEAGLALLRQAVNADHENSRVQQLICKALTDTGHTEQIELLVKTATQGLKTRLHEAKRLLRAGELDEALVAIEGELAAFPDNTTVLLECAQMNCMSLRLKKSLDDRRVEQVRDYLARLEKLLPANDRVASMRRYLRETLAALQTKGSAIEISSGPASSLVKMVK